MKRLTIQEKKDIPFGVKANHTARKAETNGRTVDIIANTYNYFDSDWDVLAPGCCAKSITERGPKSSLPGKIKHLSNHDTRKGIGRIELLEETKVNNMDVLHANSWMSETADGEETLQKYKEGLIDQHSIGYRYLDIQFLESESEEFDNVLKDLLNPQEAVDAGFMYYVREIKLWEFSSLDGFGANRLTPFLGVKSDNEMVQYNNLISKLDALLKSDADKDTLEMQTLQIKQMIYELYNPEPSGKPTPPGPGENDTFDLVKEIDEYSFNIN